MRLASRSQGCFCYAFFLLGERERPPQAGIWGAQPSFCAPEAALSWWAGLSNQDGKFLTALGQSDSRETQLGGEPTQRDSSAEPPGCTVVVQGPHPKCGMGLAQDHSLTP